MDTGLKKNTLFRYAFDEWQKVPIVVKQFLIRAILLFSFWYVGYYYVIRPDTRVDNWLTKETTRGVTFTMNKFYTNGFSSSEEIDVALKNAFYNAVYYREQLALKISHPCNGLALYVLYMGFLICVPGSIIKKVVFSIVGSIIIYILNVFRCCALVWLNLNKPEWTDFAHHYAFTTIVYVFIFLLWVMFLYEKNQE